MTKVSSTNLSQYLGGGGRLESFSLKVCSIYRFATIVLNQRSHSCTFHLFIKLVLKREASIVQRDPRSSMMLCTDNTDLSHRVLSFSNRSLIMLRAGSIGTEVNNAETHEQSYYPHRRVTPLTLFTKSLVLCIWWGGFANKWLEYLG